MKGGEVDTEVFVRKPEGRIVLGRFKSGWGIILKLV